MVQFDLVNSRTFKDLSCFQGLSRTFRDAWEPCIQLDFNEYTHAGFHYLLLKSYPKYTIDRDIADSADKNKRKKTAKRTHNTLM